MKQRYLEEVVETLGIELCNTGGYPLMADLARRIEEEDECADELLAEQEALRNQLEGVPGGPMSLAELVDTHALTPSPFWTGDLPRNGYLGP